MAIFQLQISSRSRAITSRLPHLMLDYYLREGKFSPQTPGDRWDDLRETQQANFPAWAKDDAQEFFHAAYKYERINGRYAYVIEMSLPRELAREQQLQLAEDFTKIYFTDKPYLWVLHEPLASDGKTHPHIHIIFSGKIIDAHERDAKLFFKQFNRQHPERGGNEKDLFWHKRSTPERVRESWAMLTNYYLENAGREERINHRSLFRQGIIREPARQFAGPGDTVNYAVENAIASTAWENYKKEAEFPAENISRAWMIDHFYQRAHRDIPVEERKRHRERFLEQALSRVERTIHALGSYSERLRVACEQEEVRIEKGQKPTLLIQKRQQQLLNERINIPRIPDERAWGRASRVHIFDDRYQDGSHHEREV